MKVLVACEESQAVCKAFRERGHEAYSCDIIECSGGHPEWHIQGDVLPIINGYKTPTDIIITQDGFAHCVPKRWDLIIAHPPCTYMSKAGARFMYLTAGVVNQERLKKALQAKEFFMQIMNADCDKICIENPTPLKVVDLPKESQVIQPYYFGHPYSKRTLLWLKGLPELKPTDMELSSDCVFRAYYADGSVYETDFLKRLFLNGNALLSESFAHGGTETRAGEDTDNSMYYSNVARSEALKAKDIMENSNAIREEVKLHGVYTAFAVDFESGEVEYISPSFKFKVNPETGNLDAIGQTYTLDAEIYRIVDEWLESNGVVLSELQAISTTHTQRLFELKVLTKTHSEQIDALNHEVEKVTPIEKGGTGANNVSDALKNLGAASDDLSNVTNESLKTKNIAQFKTGSYVGDGTAGVDNPNTLMFDFEPIFVMVYDEQGINAGGTGSSTLWGVHYTKGQTRQHTFGTDSSDYIYYTVNGNSFSWYHANNESGKQCNESGKTYYYIAIG